MPVGSRQVGGMVADLVAGWTRWRPGQFATPPMSPLGGETPGAVKVELYISEAWVDITRLDRDTPGVYYRDNITIQRGKSDESANLDRGSCRFTLNNRDGRFSPRNPTSPYYGKIGRNTPVRVSVVQATGIRRYRFHGEVSAWPQKWDQSGTDVYVTVEASGILRRLGQGSSPLSSPMYRGTTRNVDHLVAYWPCEDDVGSTTIASATTGVKAMTIAGIPTFSGDSTSFVCSEPLPVMANASFTGTVPTYSTSLNDHTVRFLMSYPSAGGTNAQVICRLTGTGTIVTWELYYGAGGSLGLRGFDATGANVADHGSVAYAVNGKFLRVSIELHQVGTSVKYDTATLEPNALVASTFSATVAGQTVGKITRVVMAANRGLTTVTLGHVTVQNKWTSLFDLTLQLAGNAGEHAGVRIGRLCSEEGVNFARWQPQSDTMAMGVQSEATLVDLVRECVAADLGRLSEPRDQVGLAYRDRVSLYDQTAVLALDYSLAQIADSLDPVDDDQFTRNDVTVKRESGSSARDTLDAGTLSIASVGRYDTSTTLNVQTDTLLPDLASWLLHLGTTDEARYPTIQLDLLHPTFTTSDALTTAALVLDIGDMVTVSNLPAWLPPDRLRLIVEGYTEVIGGNGQHTLSLNCSPGSPYDVAHYATAIASTANKYSPTASTLRIDCGATTASLSVTSDTTDGGQVWTTDPNELPFDIMVAGERMTVTTVTGTSGTGQTFSVTRSVNGIVKAQTAGTTVALFSPVYYDFGA